jgi:hypothetical protein
MPAFIKTPKDEARWAKAKKAASKTLSESDGDSYWALTNSIYQKMTKSTEDIEAIEVILEKARRRLSDEPDEEEQDVAPEEVGMREFDPETEDDDAAKWLAENDPEQKPEDEDESNDYQEYGPEDDEEAHRRESGFLDEPEDAGADDTAEDEDNGAGGEAEAPAEGSEAGRPPQEKAAVPEEVSEGRFPQPSREDLAHMRQYARPWEQHARDKTRLEAEASKNPVLAHEGKLVEARNMSHKDHQDAYAKMQSSPDYQNADPITQMEMDSKFEADWHKQNPDYLANAAKAHTQAHIEGLRGMGEGAKAKKEAIEHAMMGGAQPENPMSAEEAMQHAGGTKGEEGTVGTMVHDPAAKFAREHSQFLNEEGGKHQGRAASREDFYSKKAKEYAGKHKGIPEYQKGDVSKILGDHPALKDPKSKAKVDSFFEKYHPMIGMNANRVLSQLGLDKGSIDTGMLHEAGMHGLFQAINDYQHDNPSKASFATHAGNKMRGLMQTALKEQQAVPLQTEAKKYNLKQIIAKHPAEIGDRFKRVGTEKQVQAAKMPKPTGQGGMNG